MAAIPVPSSQRGNQPNQGTIFDDLVDLSRRVSVLERVSRLRSASIGAGGLTFYDGGAIHFLQDTDDLTPGTIQANSADNSLHIIAPYDGTEEDRANYIALYGKKETGSNPQVLVVSSDLVSLVVMNDSGDPTAALIVRDGSFALYGMPTTASAGNLYIDAGSGELARSVSGLKYKQDIEDVEIDVEEVLQVRGRTFRSKTDVTADPDTNKRYVGLIADEIAEFPTLRQFVDFDPDGNPDSIQYDRFSVALLAVAQDNRRRMDERDQEIAAMQEQIDAQDQKIAEMQSAIDALSKKPPKDK